MDLVDDAPARAVEQLPRAAGQHQVQRLGRRDQDVGRVAQHLLTLALGRVAGPDRDVQLGSDPSQRRAQVAIDVVGERLQRRHVDEADPPVTRVLGTRRRRQLVDRVQERGQRLAGARRRRDQHVLAGRDRRPRLLLRRGRRLERGLKPLPGARAEDAVGRHPTGLLLIGTAVALFVIDVYAPTHGELTAGGIVSFFVGSLMLFDPRDPVFRLSLQYIIPGVALTVAFFVLVVGKGVRAQRLPIKVGKETMIGKTGSALTAIDASSGKILFEGEYWNAISDVPGQTGQAVRIKSVEGCKLQR